MQHATSAEDYQEHMEDVLKIATGLALSGYGEAVGQMTGMARAFRADVPLWAVHKAHRGPQGRTRLMYAAREGDVERARFLVERGAAVEVVSNKGFSAVMIASQKGHLETVRFLVERGGAAVNARSPFDGATALLLACQNGHVNIASFLLRHGATASVNVALTTSGGTAVTYVVATSSSAPWECSR
jgi:ankyrin repeat protein